MYWDYYHDEKEFYLDWIKRHRAMGKEPIFATGLWSWATYWPSGDAVRSKVGAGMSACRETGVTEAFATAWGDDGSECNVMSLLPYLQYYAGSWLL